MTNLVHPLMRLFAKLPPVLLCTFFLSCAAHAQSLRITGAASAAPPVLDASDALKANKVELVVSTDGSSSSVGIAMLGLGNVEVAISTRHLTAEDRAAFPKTLFNEIYFGEQTAVLVVSRDVWDGGVHALTKKQATAIYEGRITNWKDVGGPDLGIVGYTATPGYGVWENYISWLYGESGRPRANRFALMSGNEQAKACVEVTPGSIAQVSMPWADGRTIFPLSIKGEDGKLIEPTTASVAAHTYPMSRPLLLIINGRSVGAIKTFTDFMLGDRGQELVRRYGYLTLQDLGVNPQTLSY